MMLPAGSIVAVHLYAMGRQDWIDRADEFIPERWAPSNPQLNGLKDLLMPFSIGKRSCIGQNLAMLELRVLAATLIRNFNFSLKEDPQFDLFITFKPKSLMMNVEPRY